MSHLRGSQKLVWNQLFVCWLVPRCWAAWQRKSLLLLKFPLFTRLSVPPVNLCQHFLEEKIVVGWGLSCSCQLSCQVMKPFWWECDGCCYVDNAINGWYGRGNGKLTMEFEGVVGQIWNLYWCRHLMATFGTSLKGELMSVAPPGGQIWN